jgi:hypothetical protein
VRQRPAGSLALVVGLAVGLLLYMTAVITLKLTEGAVFLAPLSGEFHREWHHAMDLLLYRLTLEAQAESSRRPLENR